MERHPDNPSDAPAGPITVGTPVGPTSTQSPPRSDWPRRLVNAAVTLVVLAVASGTFVLSYPGVHAIALLGGVSPQLARVYPGLFDAVLVIASVAAVSFRDARWWARCWAWLVIIVVLAAIGTTDVLHAMGYTLRHRPTEGVVAAAPVAAVLLAFSLLLTLLRQGRPRQTPDAALSRQAARRAAEQQAPAPALTAPALTASVLTASAVVPGAVPRPPAPPIALPAAFAAAPADQQDETTDQAPSDAATSAVAAPVLEVLPAPASQASEGGQEPGTAPTREDSVLAATVPVAPTAPDADPHPPNEPNEAVAPEPPAEPEASAEPYSASAPEPSAEPEPPARPAHRGIRYATSAAAEQSAPDYWESDVDPALAGQVYPVDTAGAEFDAPAYQSQQQEIDLDAPPFATAPFAPVPRLKRVRATPTPPTDDEG